jgi:choline kinase
MAKVSNDTETRRVLTTLGTIKDLGTTAHAAAGNDLAVFLVQRGILKDRTPRVGETLLQQLVREGVVKAGEVT